MSDRDRDDILRALGRIEGILEGVVPLVKEHSEDISNLKNSESYRRGQNVIISSLTSIFITVAGWWLKK